MRGGKNDGNWKEAKVKRFYLTSETDTIHHFFSWCERYSELLKPQYVTLTDVSASEFEEDQALKEQKLKIRETFLQEAEPFLLGKLPHKNWYGHTYADAQVYVFAYGADIFCLLEKYTPYLLICDEDGSAPIDLQNINIFRQNGNLLLGTVSHAGIADLFLEETEVDKLLLPDTFQEGSYTWKITQLPVAAIER